jgi:putative SOS response-associated peptidase YedK
MCGRFVAASPPEDFASCFDVSLPVEQVLEPSYNVAPTDDVYAVLESGGVRRMRTLHWGLVPHWADRPSSGVRMINARAEGLSSSNAFGPAFRRRRCIVAADGFFEWKTVPGQKTKQPMYIRRDDGEPMAFAGLWEVWHDPHAVDAGADDRREALLSCTIITTTPNEKLADVHDRMPVILANDTWDTWLDRDNDDLDTLGRLLVPAPSRIIDLYPVGPAVGNVKNNGAALIDRVDPSTGEIHHQGTLL